MDRIGFIAGAVGALLIWFAVTVLVTDDQTRTEIEIDGELADPGN